MRALVVYESLWGNTLTIAEAVADGLRHRMAVDVLSADDAPPSVDGYELLVVGGPTHAFSMSRAATRHTAVADQGAPSEPDRGIREWIDELQEPSSPVRAATFDTRVDAPRLPGSAAKAARHELRSKGFDTAIKPVSFRVHGYGGPLVDGEVARAVEWGRKLTAIATLEPA